MAFRDPHEGADHQLRAGIAILKCWTGLLRRAPQPVKDIAIACIRDATGIQTALQLISAAAMWRGGDADRVEEMTKFTPKS